MSKGRYTWAGFVALAFGVLGLLAAFATYAVPVPLERALARGEILDRVLAAGQSVDADLEKFRVLLGDSADPVLRGPGSLAERVARERAAVHARFGAEADGLARQLRLMTVVVTLMCMLFGGLVVAGLSGPKSGQDT